MNIDAELKAHPRTWLVTGGAGFIGGHIAARLLALGQKVVVLDNISSGYERNILDGVTFIRGDIRDEAVCVKACAGVDIILHQAAIGSVPKSIEDPVLVDSVNVGGTITLLMAAAKQGVKRFVYASSSAVYGDTDGEICIESRTLHPKSPYAVAKMVCEYYARVIGGPAGVCTVGLRYFNVYGPGQDPKGAYAAVIPRWSDEILADRTVEVYGDGKNVRDFCFISDVVEANIRAALADAAVVDGQVYNIGSGARTDLNDLYKHLCAAAGVEYKAPVYKDSRAGDIRISFASIDKAKKDFGFNPRFDLAEGLSETMGWYKKQR